MHGVELGEAMMIQISLSVLKGEYMTKEEICEKVRSICKEENVDFLFITEGKSCWSVSHDEHIRKVAYFHKENEPE